MKSYKILALDNPKNIKHSPSIIDFEELLTINNICKIMKLYI